MLIDEFRQAAKTQDTRKEKEIKVKIPLDHHIRLHTVKVVNGQPISSTVKAALKHYFDELRAEMEAESGDAGAFADAVRSGDLPVDR